jgi:hypothetical protein
MLNLYKLGRGKRAEDKKDGDEKPAGLCLRDVALGKSA